MKILVTSGGTKVPIDAVRDITNMSKGTFGAKICRAFLDRTDHDIEVWYLGSQDGCRPFKIDVDFTSDAEQFHMHPDDQRSINRFWDFYFWCQKVRHRCHQVYYRNYDEYSLKLEMIIRDQKPDIVVLAAAVSDYLVSNPTEGKVRSSDALSIQLAPAEKLISKIKRWHPGCKLVGFKLLVNSTSNELFQAACRSIETNGCDLVVANDLRDIKNNDHTLRLVRWNKSDKSFITSEYHSGSLHYLPSVVVAESLALLKAEKCGY
ncbi:MAG: hypothetical protein M0R80_02455 [Proteobacteria bacterium]|jgi:hypothetical protein|nr:hypothetical protein [Pseudomonadota bacterium]